MSKAEIEDLRQAVINLAFTPDQQENANANRFYEILDLYTNRLIADSYRKGYNDNARDCLCDDVSYRGFPEKVPHHHLMDDGKSYHLDPFNPSKDKI